MNPVTESIFDTPSVDQLVALRDQRALLGALRDDVQEAWRQLATSDLAGSWQSNAQRAYTDRVDYLRCEIQALARELDDAAAAVNAAIDRVKAGS